MEFSSVEAAVRLRFKKAVSRISVSGNGEHAVLTSGSALCILDLKTPYAHTRTLAHPSGTPCGPVQWSPLHSSIIASANGSALHLWDISAPKHALLSSASHRRNVRGISWSPFEAHLLASCGADNAIYLWDVRDARRPVQQKKLAVFTAGISAVKWNRQNPRILGSALDKQVEVWDIAKSAPLTFITAHATRIYDFDWSHVRENELLTCSQDKTVKFWDMTKSRECQGIIDTARPVQRAAFTPDGEAVLTLSPQVKGALRLWRLSNLQQPACEFKGHKDVVTDFDWQTLRTPAHVQQYHQDHHHQQQQQQPHQLQEGSRQRFQHSVVGWSKDAHLCIWHLPHEAASDPNISSLDSAEFALLSSSSSGVGGASRNALSRSAPGNSFTPLSTSSALFGAAAGDSMPSLMPQSLKQEIAHLQLNPVKNIRVDDANVVERTLVVTVQSEDGAGATGGGGGGNGGGNGGENNNNHNNNNSTKNGASIIHLRIVFPSLYPHNAAPSFNFLPDTTISQAALIAVSNALKHTARQLTSQMLPCLQAVLTLLSDTLQSDNLTKLTLRSQQHAPNTSSATPISEFPAPVTFGARFSPMGKLVVFGSGSAPRVRSYGEWQEAVDALQQKRVAPLVSTKLTVSQFLRSNDVIGATSPPPPNENDDLFGGSPPAVAALASRVTLYDTYWLCPLDPWLAANYWLAGAEPHELALRNAEVADRFGRHDLLRPWHMVATVLRLRRTSDSVAFVYNALHSILRHYESKNDLQTVATMVHVLASGFIDEADTALNTAFVATTAASGAPAPLPSATSTAEVSETAPETSSVLGALPESRAFQMLRVKLQSPWKKGQKSKTEGYLSPVPSSRTLDLINSPPSASPFAHLSTARNPAPTASRRTAALFGRREEQRYYRLRLLYCDYLLCCEQYNARAELLKNMVDVSMQAVHMEHSGLEFSANCWKCHKPLNSLHCASCNVIGYQCALCRLPVRGASTLCAKCGHGGHAEHIKKWFQDNSSCATGCGCCCADAVD